MLIVHHSYTIFCRLSKSMSKSIKKCKGHTGRKVCGDLKCMNSFACHPRSEFWDVKANNGLKPHEVCLRSGIKRAFRCATGCPHTLEWAPGKIVRNNPSCLYCVGSKICKDPDCKFCFKHSFASCDKAIFWHPTKNIDTDENGNENKVFPYEILLKDKKKRWFKCKVCPHDFEMLPTHIVVMMCWCPYCAKPSRKLCNDINCEFCFLRSCATNEKMVATWSDDNGKIKPHMVMISSNKPRYFDCKLCPHTFEVTPGHVTNMKSWCPYCAKKKLCGDLSCDMCNTNSCASITRIVEAWSSKNKNQPHEVAGGSHDIIYLDCKKCLHIFKKTPHILNGKKKKKEWCPYCSKWAICKKEECELCLPRTCAAHVKMLTCWDVTNKKQPYEISLNSTLKMKFKCTDCLKKFILPPCYVNGSGMWCPHCRNTTEKRLLKWLKAKFPNLVITFQFRADWCKNSKTNRHLPLDFYIEEFNLVIELDGMQHFYYVKLYNNCPIKTLQNDLYKTRMCTENGCTIIRLLQTDVWYDKNNWEARIIDALHKYSKPQVVLLDNKGEYDPLRTELKKVANKKRNRSRRQNNRRLIQESSSSSEEEQKVNTKKTIGMRGRAKVNTIRDPSSKRSC